MVDGTLDVVIGNRGTQSLHDLGVSDGLIVAGVTPMADIDAQKYYESVSEWANAEWEDSAIIHIGRQLPHDKIFRKVVHLVNDTTVRKLPARKRRPPGRAVARPAEAQRTRRRAVFRRGRHLRCARIRRGPAPMCN